MTETIRWALANGAALEVMGRGSRRALGRPVQSVNRLDVSAMSGIVSYEPAELVLTALAGTPMSTVEAALAEHAQCLAFEPPDLSALFDVRSGAGTPATARAALATGGTFGGAIATGLSGPRRFKAGGARDHVLGIAAVSGRGEAFVGGGKVVKNVTGYDIPKLVTGSYGTLAVLTEVTVKVLPRAQDERTVLVSGLALPAAVRVMTDVLQSSVDPSGACYLPEDVVMPGTSSEGWVTAFRLEGFPPSVKSRRDSLRARLQSSAFLSELDCEASVAFWRAVRDVSAFADASDGLVWRISVPPASAGAVVERMQRTLSDAKLFLDWGGGLIWLATRETDAIRVREALGDTGGHATLIRAPADVRARVEVFQPQSSAVAALSKRVKAQFDPAGVLNPGRMYAGV